MKCPFCSTLDNKVIDSRLSKGGEVTRRRRECAGCDQRYTTYERVERALPLVIKRDGSREPFDHLKILRGLKSACVKRPVTAADLEGLLEEITSKIADSGRKEIPSREIGERVLSSLKNLDQVAYVRFASVYRSFKDAREFMRELSRFLGDESP